MRMRDLLENTARREKGVIYVSAEDNMDYWGGYFPGFTRSTFKRVPGLVTILAQEDFAEYGVVRLRGVTLKVRRGFPEDEWEIDGKAE